MDVIELLEIIGAGEDSKTQFKEFFSSPDALAAEITAFANTNGGRIVVGVSDDGELIGLTLDKVAHLNQMISNVCSQKIDPPLSVETENVKYEDRIVVVINVPRGINKFYVANGRDVWVKVGADKRRASREEMRRLLQESSNIFADEQPIPGTDISSLDRSLLEGFIENKTGEKIENISVSLKRLLNNMKLMRDDNCTLAGLLLFGKRDNQILSQHIISAVSWYGNDPAGTEYRDSEDIKGHVLDLFQNGMAFLKRQLRKKQKGQDFNSLGILEIPEVALEEALVNAIVHRNYYVESNIRLFVFDNRVEIISPGCLPNTLSVETIKNGVHIARNPILLSHIKDIKGIPYRGIGTGITRIIKSCKEEGVSVDFIDEVEKNQFKVVFWRE
jgi:predicted HTH transcriptional regulator